jgi:hypothetical protein
MKIYIIIIFIILSLIITIYFLNTNYSKRNIPSSNIPPLITTIVPAKWYNNYFPEEEFTTQPFLGKKVVGLAFSGGGTRAACTTWGFLQALNDYKINGKSLLHIDNISYISANSGSTWILLPLLYEPMEGTSFEIDDILGPYISDPSTLDYKKDIDIKQFGYNAVNSSFDLEFENNWWSYSVGNSFFKPYGLYEGNTTPTNRIVGYNADSIKSIIASLGSNYKGVVLRPNMPIPIAVASLIINKDTVVGIDSTPTSSGFLRHSNASRDINKLGGRVDSYAFNTFLAKIVTTDPDTQDILVDFRKTKDNYGIYHIKDTWDPVCMSGTSSMASGMELIELNLPNSFPFLGSFDTNVKDVNSLNPNNQQFKIIDGYNWDDTGVVSLVARKTEKIASIISCALDDITGDIYTEQSYTYLFIVDGLYANNIGKFVSFDSTKTKVNLSINNVNTSIDVSIEIGYVKVFSIGQIYKLFGKGLYTQIFNDNDYYKTQLGLLTNYATTGIFYYKDTYTTIVNENLNITSYQVDVLLYCLSPCPNFYSKLSVSNRNYISDIYKNTNICTIFPFYNDCNLGSCDNVCRQSQQDILTDLQNVTKITNVQAQYISTLSGWICNQILIPFLLDMPFPEQTYSLYQSQIIIKPTSLPTDEQKDVIKNIAGIVLKAINDKVKTLPNISQDLKYSVWLTTLEYYYPLFIKLETGAITLYTNEILIEKDKSSITYSLSKIKISTTISGSGKHQGGRIGIFDMGSGKGLIYSDLITLDNIKFEGSFSTDLSITDDNKLLNIDFNESNYIIDNFSITNISDIIDTIWDFIYHLNGWGILLDIVIAIVGIPFIKDSIRDNLIIPLIETNINKTVQNLLTNNKENILNYIFPSGDRKIAIPIKCKYCIFPDQPNYSTPPPTQTPYINEWIVEHKQELENFINLFYINNTNYPIIINRLLCISEYIQKNYTYDYFIKNKFLIQSQLDTIYNTNCNLSPEPTPCVKKCQQGINCGGSDGCGGYCPFTLITTINDSIKWTLQTLSGTYNNYTNYMVGSDLMFRSPELGIFLAKIVPSAEDGNKDFDMIIKLDNNIINSRESKISYTFIPDKNVYLDYHYFTKIFPSNCFQNNDIPNIIPATTPSIILHKRNKNILIILSLLFIIILLFLFVVFRKYKYI